MVRISQNFLSERILYNLQTNILRVSQLQEQLSTGRRINRPADDPVDFPSALNLRSTIQQGRSYMSNIQGARTNLELTETTMDSLTDVLQTIRTLAVQGGNDADPDARLAIANQISELNGQILDLANANFNGQYIFSGGKTNAQAFVVENGMVVYKGDDFMRDVSLSQGAKVTTNLTGFDTFLHTPNQITASVSIADASAPLAEQLRLANPNFPNLPPSPDSPSGTNLTRSANPDNSPTSKPNNYASFYIHDVEIKVDLSVDSLQDVRDRINASTSEAVASINSDNQLVITSKRTDALDLRDGGHPIGFEADPPFGANLLGALGMYKRVDGYRNLASGYPAASPLTDGTASPAPARSHVTLNNSAFLFAAANTGPSDNAASPFGDNMAITDMDADGNEAFKANGDPQFIDRLEAVRITIDGEVVDIDLRSLTQGRDFDGVEGNADDVPGSSLGDLLELINNHPSLKGRATAYINSTGTGIGVTAVNSTDVFKVENVRKLFGRDITTDVAIDAVTGEAAISQTDKLTENTKLDDLPGALVDETEGGSLGVRRADPMPAGLPPAANKGFISIQNNGTTTSVDLREAETIGDVIRAINESKAGVRAEINESGTGINVESAVGNSEELSIVDVGEGTTARDLGLFSPPAPKRIQSDQAVLANQTVAGNYPAASEGAFQIELRDGSGATMDTYSISISKTDTMADIVKKIDEADGQSGPGGGAISANLTGGVLNIVSHYNGQTIFIDSGKDTTGTDAATRFTALIGIDKYSYTLESEVNPLTPYESKQNTASILGVEGNGTVKETIEKNVFLSVKNLEQALRNDDTDGVTQALADLDIDLNQILDKRTTLGGRINRLDSAESRWQEGEDFLRQQLSSIEDADFAQTVSDYTLAQNAFNASLQAAAKVIQQSLLDFLG
ncbi:MAG: flagellar hook-associated protein FlgL [Candidatus Omnitrophota bacterium]